MGRFDALTQLEDQSWKTAPSPVVPSPTLKRPSTQPLNKQSEEGKKLEIMKSRNHEGVVASDDLIDEPEKYSTLLKPSLAKKIKIFAAERDIQNYEVIALALKEFFEKQK